MRSALAFLAKGTMLYRLFCSSTAKPNPSLFVSGLCKRTTSERLRDAFSEFGDVVSVRVVVDKSTNYSKGYGFVRYTTAEEAQKGLEGMDGKFLDEWVISAEYAKPTATHATPQNNRSLGYQSSRYPSRGCR